MIRINSLKYIFKTNLVDYLMTKRQLYNQSHSDMSTSNADICTKGLNTLATVWPSIKMYTNSWPQCSNHRGGHLTVILYSYMKTERQVSGKKSTICKVLLKTTGFDLHHNRHVYINIGILSIGHDYNMHLYLIDIEPVDSLSTDH